MLESSDNDQKEAVTEILQQIISSKIASANRRYTEKQNENFRAENYQVKKLCRWTQQNRRVREKKMKDKAI